MAFDGFSGFLNFQFNYAPSKNGPSSGITFPANGLSNTLTKKISYVLGGNVAGGVNEVALNIVTIAASGNTTLDLTSLTDVLGFASVALVRVKAFFFWLLSAADDSVNGTACSGVTVGNAATNANLLNMGGTTPTFTLGNGEVWAWGTGKAAGLTVDATHKNVLITNNDGAVAAAVLYGFAGATT